MLMVGTPFAKKEHLDLLQVEKRNAARWEKEKRTS